jgi:amino acid adenylation domain-containing protein
VSSHPSAPTIAAAPRAETDLSIASSFERQVGLQPDRLAVRTLAHAWTYTELNGLANRIARVVLARDGAEKRPVAILVEQGAPLIAAFLGVLKAGKLAVVLDPSHPQARLARLIAEAEATCVITNAGREEAATRLAGRSNGIIRIDAVPAGLSEANLDVESDPEDPAMILYTSGSTGQPKGVVCTHRTWVHNTRNYVDAFQIGPEDRITLLALGTAQAVKNILLAVLTGATLFPFDVKRDGLDGLADLLRREGITVTVLGASLFRSLADVLRDGRVSFPALRLIRLGSEAVHASDVELYRRHFSSHCRLVNGLASSETQTICFFPIDHATRLSGTMVPVGYPAPDKAVLILDEAGQSVPPGEVGEIVVESRYLASGYWRRPDLTDAVFQPAEIAGGPRRYHTGDLGRVEFDGALVCLGRKNSRVKIRGHGVDLLEIEAALRTLDEVKDAVVVAQRGEAGYARLVAYVVPVSLPGPTNETLRRALGRTLADFMIPSTFVILADLPRTSSGKTDREALPAPGRPYQDPHRPATGPRTAIETQIAAIWSEVMSRDWIDVHAHFYDLGGESLQAMRIMARIRKSFSVDVDLQSLLETPTVAEMAQSVAERMAAVAPETSGRLSSEATAERSPLVIIQPGHGRRPVFFIPGGAGGEGEFFVYARLAHHVGPEYPFYGLRARSASGREVSARTVEEIATEYLADIRSREAEGPYLLVGECGGGVVAYEMAQQLHLAGQEPALLVLMDTLRPDVPFAHRALVRRFTRWSYHREALRLEGRERFSYVVGLGQRIIRRAVGRLRRLAGDLSIDDVAAIQQSYSQTIHRYRPRPYRGKLTLLVSEELARVSPTLGWDDLVLGGVEPHRLPGHHVSYIRGDVSSTARMLRACLDRATPAAELSGAGAPSESGD